MSAFTPKAPQALQAAVELKDLSRGLAQSVGLFFYSLLKCLKSFIVLLPNAVVGSPRIFALAPVCRLPTTLPVGESTGSQKVFITTNGPPASPHRRRHSSRMLSRSLLMILCFPVSPISCHL